MQDAQNRRQAVSEKAGRITGKLQTGDRLDPEDFDDHDDVAHHYAATLKPGLADLDPAQKAAAIRGYVEDTGIAPDAAVKTLLGLAVTGDPANRIAAARELAAVFKTNPTARDKAPPALAAHAELMVQLADTEAISPDKVVEEADGVFGTGEPGAGPDQPNPGLVLLAKVQNNAGTKDSPMRYFPL